MLTLLTLNAPVEITTLNISEDCAVFFTPLRYSAFCTLWVLASSSINLIITGFPDYFIFDLMRIVLK